MLGYRTPNLAHFTDILGVAKTSRFGHVERHPSMPIIDHLQNWMGQKLENACFQVSVARLAIGTDQGVVWLHADDSGSVQQRRHFALTPLGADHRQAEPAALWTFCLEVCVPDVYIKVQVRHAKSQAADLPVRKNRAVAVLRGGGIDRLKNFVHPVLPAHGVRHGREPGAWIRDVGMCIDNPAWQPAFQVLRPERPVCVGVLPEKMEGDGIHGVLSCGNECKYPSNAFR